MTKLSIALDYSIAIPYLRTTTSKEKLERIRWRDCLANRDYNHPIDCLVVYDDSNRKKREAVEMLARLFRREFHYEFVQYSAKEADSCARAFLWLDKDSAVIGATVFRLRDEDEGDVKRISHRSVIL